MTRRLLLVALASTLSGCLYNLPLFGATALVFQAETEADAQAAAEVFEQRMHALNPWNGKVSTDGTTVFVNVPPMVNVEALQRTGRLSFFWESAGETGRWLPGPPGYWVEEPPLLGRAQIEGATLSYDASGMPVVNLALNANGTALFGRSTAENVGRRLVIVVEDKVIFAPVVREAISGGLISVSLPDQTQGQAMAYTMWMAAGPLPPLVLKPTID